VLGCINVLPTYRFLHSTSAKGILDYKIKKFSLYHVNLHKIYINYVIFYLIILT
jgi:hypothetical protein